MFLNTVSDERRVSVLQFEALPSLDFPHMWRMLFRVRDHGSHHVRLVDLRSSRIFVHAQDGTEVGDRHPLLEYTRRVDARIWFNRRHTFLLRLPYFEAHPPAGFVYPLKDLLVAGIFILVCSSDAKRLMLCFQTNYIMKKLSLPMRIIIIKLTGLFKVSNFD